MSSSPPPHVPLLPEGYRALREDVAWADVGPRTAVFLTGEDALRFVDGFCTAAVARLPPGGASEAFFLDARGQVLSWGSVFRAADGVWIDADVPPAADDADPWSLAAHLDRYHIRERLRLADAAAALGWVLVAGPRAGAWLERAGARLPGTGLAHDADRLESLAAGAFPGRVAGVPAAVLRGGWGGEGSFLIVVPAAERATLLDRLRDDGLAWASPEAIDAVRREDGRPSPVDIPPRCLAQELGRDRQAIAFDKGCYLGQETVARLDALGHVNRRLVGVHSPGPTPLRPGVAVEVDGEPGPVGIVTSAGPSPRHGGWLGLALVRVTALRSDRAWRVAGDAVRAVTFPTTEGA